MVLKIYGITRSTSTWNVEVVCKELDVPYELVILDVENNEHKSPKYLSDFNPFGLFPVMDDNGFRLYESRAIGRYLASKYGGGKLVPAEADLQKRALFEQAASVEQNNFGPHALGIVAERFFKPVFRKQETNEENALQSQKTLEEKLQVYEVILGKQKYLAGDEITLADLFHLPFGQLMTSVLGLKVLTATPNVARWWKDISSRPSWLAVKSGVGI